MPRLFVRGSDGTVCIHTGSDNVVDTPTADLSRVLFHSALNYPAIIARHTVSLTLPSRATRTYATHTLAAHGQSGIPFVMGYITNLGGVPVALAGTVPMDNVAASTLGLIMRYVTLGADATNIILHEHSEPYAFLGHSIAARTIDLVLYVTDLIP